MSSKPDGAMPTDAEMEIFNRGVEAHERGTERDDNPYDEDKQKNAHNFWMFGWVHANTRQIEEAT